MFWTGESLGNGAVSSQRRIHRGESAPDVYFLPMAVSEPKQVPGVDVGVVCRGIPEFLHHLLDHGGQGSTAVLAVDKLKGMEADELFELLSGEGVRALVTGMLHVGHDGFELETRVHFRPEPDPITPVRLAVTMDVRNPVPVLARLADRLAGVLELPCPVGSQVRGLLTQSTQAFYKLLEALDGQPVFAEVLSLDPGFGLALRVAKSNLAAALAAEQIDRPECCRVLDGCLQALPRDGDACVQVAEFLHRLGERQRAVAWLEHATGLAEPPAAALEALGCFLLEQGHARRARELWQRGALLDGHPNFCAHLAGLAFSERDLREAWSQVAWGLRRVAERLARRQEWAEERPNDLLLRCVAEQIENYPPPGVVAMLVAELCGRLSEPEERVELGICLLGLGRVADARIELQAALTMDLELGARDRAVRAMLALDVPGFERRFAAAVKSIRHGRNPGRGMRAMREFLIRQPEFWPGLFHLAVGFRRQDRQDEALDALADVLQVSPGQVETLVEMAELFAARGNPKRALECVEEALNSCGPEVRAGLHLRRAEYLGQLDRPEAAAAAARRALEMERTTGASA